jgi:hypothetical protein
MTRMVVSLVQSLGLLSLVACGSALADPVITLIVPGTSDPWLAGMPPGSVASFLDVAPAQSPVQVTGLSIVPGTALSFSASGLVSNGVCGPPFCPFFGPDGGIKPDQFPLFHESGSENGISNLGSPINALVGVFLGPDPPSLQSPPSVLDFNTASRQDYLVLSPLVRQTFFIGDGLASGTTGQQVIVPAGATRLFLGTADGCCWLDNQGAFTVQVAQIPEPATVTLLLVGMCALLVLASARRDPVTGLPFPRYALRARAFAAVRPRNSNSWRPAAVRSSCRATLPQTRSHSANTDSSAIR